MQFPAIHRSVPAAGTLACDGYAATPDSALFVRGQ